MRQFILSTASCLALALAGAWPAARPAQAQTATTAPPPADAAAVPKPKPPAKPAAAKPAAPVSSVVVPIAPPPPPVLPPPIEVPVRPETKPPPAPIADDAPGSFAKIASGLRVTFGPGRADLNPDTAAALRALAHTAAPGSDTAFNVTAFAAGTPDDPSTARRLSLSRALTARSLLMGEGVPSVQIYVKALGAASPAIAEAAPDRVDVTIAIRPHSQAPAVPTPPQKAAP